MDNMVTAKQLKEITEITRDKKSIDHSLKIAMEFHANSTCRLNEKESAWWDEVCEINGLDRKKSWRINTKGAFVTVEEASDGER